MTSLEKAKEIVKVLDNKKAKNFNKIGDLDRYLKENCAYECKYFVAKKNNM